MIHSRRTGRISSLDILLAVPTATAHLLSRCNNFSLSTTGLGFTATILQIRRRLSLFAEPARAQRSASIRASSTSNRTSRGDPDGGGLGIASYLLGDVSNFSRYVSNSLDAGERQNRQFFYGQDTWRMTPKLTLNYRSPLGDLLPANRDRGSERRLAQHRHGRSDDRRCEWMSH